MTEIERLTALLEQVYGGEPGSNDGWHGPSLRKLTSGLTAADAVQRPLAHGHSIWELVLHIAAWDEIAARRLQGEQISATTGSPGDWPALAQTTEAAWEQALAWLRQRQRHLLAAVAALSDLQLDERVIARPETRHRMIHGTLHHDLYHAGQIGQLRRALGL